LAALAALHPQGAEGLLSRRSARWQELAAEERPLGADALLDLLAREPALLKRPLITDGAHLVVGYDEAALARAFGPPPRAEPPQGSG
jgi:arsenate reductase-like glutaredoxin family protein